MITQWCEDCRQGDHGVCFIDEVCDCIHLCDIPKGAGRSRKKPTTEEQGT